MSMNNSGIGRRLDTWRFLLDQSRSFLGDVPHLVTDHAELEALIKEIEVRRANAVTTANASVEANRLRREAEGRGMEVRDRLAAGLVQQFGSYNQKLADFGLVPKKRSRPRKTKPTEEPEAPPATSKATASEEPPTT